MKRAKTKICSFIVRKRSDNGVCKETSAASGHLQMPIAENVLALCRMIV